MNKIEKALYHRITEVLRFLFRIHLRLRLRNNTFSLISQNCNGMFMLKDLNQQYNSPFINLWMYPRDFIKFLENMDYYLEKEISFIKYHNCNYPVGIIDDIRIFFMHFETEKEAEEKWNKRKKRINKNNLFILMTDRDECTYEDLVRFDNLPYKNKVVFTHVKHSDIVSAVYIPGFDNEDSVGLCYEYTSEKSYKRHQDAFDYVNWFNNN